MNMLTSANPANLAQPGAADSNVNALTGQSLDRTLVEIRSGRRLEKIANSLTDKIRDGKLYKGKAGESFRIYTCRLLECFAMCSVPLSPNNIAIFAVTIN